jgi:hypothetical protein
MDRWEELTRKYWPVLRRMTQLDVELRNLHLQDNKLILQGLAHTDTDSKLVWKEIERVDPDYSSDLVAEIGYETRATSRRAPGSGEGDHSR